MSTDVTAKSPAELEEMLNDPARMKDILGDGEKFRDFCGQYAKGVMEDHNGELIKQLKEGLQNGMTEWIRENREPGGVIPANGVPTGLRVGNRADRRRLSSAERALWNKRAPGVKAEGIFDDAVDLFQASWHARDRYQGVRDQAALAQKLHKLNGIMNSFGSEVPADGGFLIPETLRSELLQVALETSVVRSRATVIPMDSLRVPIPMIDDTSHVSSVLGGITAYWAEESAALTESQASFGRAVLDAKKLTAFANVPNELLQDAPAFAGFFDAKFPQAISYFEDIGFMTGTGTGEPLGYVNCPASVQVAAEAGQPTQTIVWENITKMYARMLPTSLGSAVWVASIDTFPQLATMALSVGTGGGPVWIGNMAGTGGGGADSPPVTILGRPVIFTEKTPALGTTGDLSFVDFSYYLIGDRMQMQSSNSPHYRFQNDQTSFRIIQRVDGRPWLQSAITPHNNSSNTLTPFVQLASR